MAVLSLPLNFGNSFWSQEYRRGLEVLFNKLDQGVYENDEIITFIRNRIRAESDLANSFIRPPLTGKPGTGFDADEGASLLLAFRGLQGETAAQGQVHLNIANELEQLVADPFDNWAQAYKERLREKRTTVIDNWLRAYEQGQNEVSKFKSQYLDKTRRADEAEDDAKFAPTSNGPDTYTLSPRTRPIDAKRSPPQRTASVSERIALRLKEIQKKSAEVIAAAATDSDNEDGKETPKIDKGKGRAIEGAAPPEETTSPISLTPAVERTASPAPPLHPLPMLLAGLSLSKAAVSQLLTQAAADLPLRSVRFPLLGEYHDAFTGEEFVAWLNANVQGFGGSLDRAEDAARDLTERDDLLRRLGELGNQFEHSDDAWYQFRPKAFNLEASIPEPSLKNETLFKRTGNFVNLVSKALNANNAGEPAFVKARHEAEDADKTYRVAVRRLDRQRLDLEERIEETLRLLQRWEAERLAAVKTVLLQYQGTVLNLPKSLEPSIERSATLIAAYQPESDLTALIERYRTGPFRPTPQIYESVAHDEADAVFGIDLRKWTEGQEKEVLPPVFTALLSGVEQAYTRLPNDIEKRKAWIYEVPLPAVHHLRETLNAVEPGQAFNPDLFTRFDAPVIASTVKLWFLELNPPIGPFEVWDDFRRMYPTVGSAAKGEGEITEELRLQNLGTVLQRLPRIHLFVLDGLISHIKGLIESTKVEESDEIYITKLALSFGRAILRPKAETELSIQDRHPTLLFIDLLKNYDAILPPTIARKKREAERKIPIRKRTAAVDMRLSRNRMSADSDALALLAAQRAAQNPSTAKQGLATSPKKLVPPPPPPPAVAVAATTQLVPPPPPPASVVERLKTPPAPPPPAPAQSLVPPPPPTGSLSTQPPRPDFKEPLSETPPRPPNFKEPDAVESSEEDSSEDDDDDDDDEDDDDESGSDEGDTLAPAAPVAALPAAPPPVVAPPPPPPVTSVIPPTPNRHLSYGSRSPSPSVNLSEDVVLGTGKPSIRRAGSGETHRPIGSITRGPRIAKGPRAPSSGGSLSISNSAVGAGGAGGNVSNMIQSLNRATMSGSPTPGGASAATPRTANRLSGGSPVRRPLSLVGRSAASLQRRSMASDAEDNVVDR